MIPQKRLANPAAFYLLSNSGFGFFCNAVVIGVLGWLLETFIYYLEYHRLYDCGFLIMPWCPIYAMGILLVLLFLRYIPERRHTFPMISLVSAVCATVLEGSSGILFYHFHLTLWNYSVWPLSNRYISLPASIGWGIGGAVYLLFVYPWIDKKAAGILPAARKTLLFTFLSLVILDYLITFAIIFHNGGYSPLY